MKDLSICCFLLAFASILHAQTPEIKWWFDLNDSAFGNAAAADIDEDGYLEIVFGCYRNDSTIYALNAENGSLLWRYNTSPGFAEGCNDVAPLIADIDQDNVLEVVVPSSCNPRTYAFSGPNGQIEWETSLHGSDSPPTVADIDGDDKLEVLHGNFGGYVSCLNGEDGSINWDIIVDGNSWIQTAPIILDANNDGSLDFIVANWSFGDDHRIFCYQGDNQTVLWTSELPNDVMYHGASFADIDQDGFQEIMIGSYDGHLYCLNAEDGSLAWEFAFPDVGYIPSPTSVADLDQDMNFEIVFFDGNHLGVLNHDGSLLWDFVVPEFGQSFRGAAISDINNDQILDVIFGSDNGKLYALGGIDGTVIWSVDLASHYGSDIFNIDHGPLVADFDKDGFQDIFVVGGFTEFPDFQNNFGRAYLISTQSPGGPEWLMFRRDSVRSATVPLDFTTNTLAFEEKNEVKIFPNPSSGQIQISSTARLNSIKLFNLQGKLLAQFKGNLSNLDLSVYPAGVYSLHIAGEVISHHERIVIH